MQPQHQPREFGRQVPRIVDVQVLQRALDVEQYVLELLIRIRGRAVNGDHWVEWKPIGDPRTYTCDQLQELAIGADVAASN